jgi:phosphoribosyl-AMP cyclohydrolase
MIHWNTSTYALLEADKRFAGKEQIMSFADELKYDGNGLVTVVIQDAVTNEFLTLAYMNREAVQRTLEMMANGSWFMVNGQW